MKRKFYSASILLFISTLCLGFEVDDFTQRYEPLKDSRAELNTNVNSRLQKAVDSLNSKFWRNCDKEKGFEAANGELSGWIVGSVESYANQSKTIDKHEQQNRSIYANRDLASKTSGFVMTLVGLDPSINLNGSYVGVDKLGHFFDQGQEYFQIYKENGSNEAATLKAIQYGIKLEEGMYGWATTGVKSFGDASANYSGFSFWKQLTDGDHPYLKCENNTWKLARKFDWADYVNSSWDEATNCSDFRNPSMANAVQRRARELEAEYRRRGGPAYKFVCPTSANECVKLQKTYGNLADKILSPKCLHAVADNSTLPVSGQTAAATTVDAIKRGKK